MALSAGMPRAFAAECGIIGQAVGVCAAIDKLDNRLAETSKLAEKAAQAAIMAVPGERYMRLIDDLHSQDAARKQAAQAFLTSLMGVKPEDVSAYRLSVGFDFDESKTFAVDVQRFAAPEKSQLEAYLQFSAEPRLPPRVILAPVNQDEVRKRLLNVADRIIGGITGPLGVEEVRNCTQPSLATTICGTFSFRGAITAPEARQLKGAWTGVESANALLTATGGGENYLKLKGQLREALADLVLEAISYRETRNVAKEIGFDWPVLADKNFVVIFVDKDTYNAQSDWKIALRVHKKNEPNQSLLERPVHILTKSDFDPKAGNQPLKGRAGKEFYWATREMTGNVGDFIAQAEAIKRLRDTYEDWKKVLGSR